MLVLLQSKQFASKSEAQQKLIVQALEILSALGMPMNKTPRALECMALSFLAVVDMKPESPKWSSAKDLNDNRALKTRDIINFINEHYSENISSGSYDDIRRKHLKWIVMSSIVIHSKPNSARNDPSRAYALNPEYSGIIRIYGDEDWPRKAEKFMFNRQKLIDRLAALRELEQIPVKIPSGETLSFSPGGHNELQKEIVERFLPRYGYGAELLYIGDAAKKFLINNVEKLKKLNFFELSHGELPDIIAYSECKNWLYLIEAVYSSNPMSPERIIELKRLTEGCKADVIFVTAFLNRATFRKFVADIAWGTEVWIASDPDHLIHFNGDKFLGPYVDQ